MLNVLFLCTGNSCRSILAEAYANHVGGGEMKAFSAGSFPTGVVNPKSLETLKRHNIKIDGLKSKSWDEFKNTNIDLVITVCDNAAGEVCPIFPGNPAKIHWGVPDPAHFAGTEEEIKKEFERVFAMLKRPIDELAALILKSIDKKEILEKAQKIKV